MSTLLRITLFVAIINQGSCFWDIVSTTMRGILEDTEAQVSMFRWQWVHISILPNWMFWNIDWDDMQRRRRLHHVAGISIDLFQLSTAVILNRRVLITSYNYLDPYINRQHDLRIWALGRSGLYNTPYRYRVYRVTRLIPLSLNPEHCHGPRCSHNPRHDVSIIISLDQMYVYRGNPTRYMYPYRAFLFSKYQTLTWDIWSAGSGYEYLQHVFENYKISYTMHKLEDIADCSKYLPKWWGKFICIKNVRSFPGIQNGGGLFSHSDIAGIGCFEIRYNEDRYLVFTDLRYYYDYIHYYAYISPGQYYEYAYPQWGVNLGWFWDSAGPKIPKFQIMKDLYPLG